MWVEQHAADREGKEKEMVGWSFEDRIVFQVKYSYLAI